MDNPRPCTLANDQSVRHPWPVLLFLVMFLICVIGAYVWFLPQPHQSIESIWVEPRQGIPGLVFTANPPSEAIMQGLGTSNLIQGSFVGPRGEEYTVFLASWKSADGKKLNVVHHTPDMCWVGAGWKPIELGQPAQVMLSLPRVPDHATQADRVENYRRPTAHASDQSATAHDLALTNAGSAVILPFECRIFQSPDRSRTELTFWCTLIGGRALPESNLFRSEKTLFGDVYEDNQLRLQAAARRAAALHLYELVRQRLPAKGEKQFVRFSLCLQGNWQVGLVKTRAFVLNWLRVDRRSSGS